MDQRSRPANEGGVAADAALTSAGDPDPPASFVSLSSHPRPAHEPSSFDEDEAPAAATAFFLGASDSSSLCSSSAVPSSSSSASSSSSSSSAPTAATSDPAPPRPALLYTALFAIQLVFVVWMYVAKYAMAHANLPPLVLAFYREVVATATLLAMVRCTSTSSEVRSALRDDVGKRFPSFLLLGFLMFACVAGYVAALSMVSPFNAAVFQPTQPIFASVLAWVAGSESMSKRKALSVAMACSGAALTVWLGARTAGEGPTPTPGGDDDGGGAIAAAPAPGGEGWYEQKGSDDGNALLLGNVLLLIQCMGGGAHWVVQKRILAEVRSPLVVTAASYAIGSAFTVAVTLAVRGPADPLLRVASPIAWAAIAYAAVAATAFTYSAGAWANKWADPSTVTLSSSLQPLLAAAFDAVDGGGPGVPSTSQLSSCALIVAGLGVKVYDQEDRSLRLPADQEADGDTEDAGVLAPAGSFEYKPLAP